MAKKKLDVMGLPKNPGGSILSVFVSLPKQYIAMRQQITLSIAKGLTAPFKRAGSWKRKKSRRFKARFSPRVRARKVYRRKTRAAGKRLEARWKDRQQAAPVARGNPRPETAAAKRAAAPPPKPQRPVHRPVEDPARKARERRTTRRPAATPPKRDNRECAECEQPASDQDGELYAYDGGWYHDQCMREHIERQWNAQQKETHRRRRRGPVRPPGPQSRHQVGVTRR
jgi:hypothetical protein